RRRLVPGDRSAEAAVGRGVRASPIQRPAAILSSLSGGAAARLGDGLEGSQTKAAAGSRGDLCVCLPRASPGRSLPDPRRGAGQPLRGRSAPGAVRTDFLAGADRRDLPPGFPAWLALRNLPLPSSGISAADARGARGVSRAVAALLSGDRQPEPDPEERLHGLGRSRREYELLRSRPLSGGLGRPGEVRSGALESA